jgi:hypothetical protein
MSARILSEGRQRPCRASADRAKAVSAGRRPIAHGRLAAVEPQRLASIAHGRQRATAHRLDRHGRPTARCRASRHVRPRSIAPCPSRSLGKAAYSHCRALRHMPVSIHRAFGRCTRASGGASHPSPRSAHGPASSLAPCPRRALRHVRFDPSRHARLARSRHAANWPLPTLRFSIPPLNCIACRWWKLGIDLIDLFRLRNHRFGNNID